MGRERFEVEFGRYSDWLVEACSALGVDPVPAVCRGTGRPALLELLSRPLDARHGKTILDLGCGLGGPATWLMRSTGAEVVGVDVMQQSIDGVRRLNPEMLGVVASLEQLPMADERFDGAWCLGVLEMLADVGVAAAEMGRVLRPGSPLVVYDFVSTEAAIDRVPDADRFSSPGHTVLCLERAGFVVHEASALPRLPATPEEWTQIRDSVRDEVRRRHGLDPMFEVVEGELQKFRDLVAREVIEEWIFLATKEGR